MTNKVDNLSQMIDWHVTVDGHPTSHKEQMESQVIGWLIVVFINNSYSIARASNVCDHRKNIDVNLRMDRTIFLK